MKKALFYPDMPIRMPDHTLSKTIRYFSLLGYELTNDIDSDWEIAVFWKWLNRGETKYNIPRKLDIDKRLVLNRNLIDVSKSHVDKVFTTVFGYSSMADTNQHGFCVRKSESQSAHDGEIVQTPCKKEPGYVYQKLIDSRSGIDMVYDIRIPVFFGSVPLVVIKGRDIQGTFENTIADKHQYLVKDPEKYLSGGEMMKIAEFCFRIGLDIGEIDALRDNSTGLLYIIDINDMPGSALYNHIPNAVGVERELAEYLNHMIKCQK